MINAKRNEKNSRYIWSNSFFVIPLQPQISNYGTLADRLGNGLQNRVEQFDSARCLLKLGIIYPKFFYFKCLSRYESTCTIYASWSSSYNFASLLRMRKFMNSLRSPKKSAPPTPHTIAVYGPNGNFFSGNNEAIKMGMTTKIPNSVS